MESNLNKALAPDILARLQASGLLTSGETRVLIDQAITTLEPMPFQEETVKAAHLALEGLSAIRAGMAHSKP